MLFSNVPGVRDGFILFFARSIASNAFRRPCRVSQFHAKSTQMSTMCQSSCVFSSTFWIALPTVRSVVRIAFVDPIRTRAFNS